MKAYGVLEIQLQAFLTSTLGGGEWLFSRLGHFTHGEKALGTHWMGGWMGLRAGLDAVAERKIPCPCRQSNPGRPARCLITVLTELFRILGVVIAVLQCVYFCPLDSLDSLRFSFLILAAKC
jgi:hypothetical protein